MELRNVIVLCAFVLQAVAHVACGEELEYPDDFALLYTGRIGKAKQSMLRKCFGGRGHDKSLGRCGKLEARRCGNRCAAWVPGNRYGMLVYFACLDDTRQTCCCQYNKKSTQSKAERKRYESCQSLPLCKLGSCQSQCAQVRDADVTAADCTSPDTCCCAFGRGSSGGGKEEKCFEASDHCAQFACEFKCRRYGKDRGKSPAGAQCIGQGKAGGNERSKCCCTYE